MILLHTRTNTDVLVTCDFLFLNATVCLYLKGWYGSWCGRGRRWNDTLLAVSTFDAAQLANALSHRVLIRAYVRARCELHAVVANTRTAISTKNYVMKQFRWSRLDSMICGQVKFMQNCNAMARSSQQTFFLAAINMGTHSEQVALFHVLQLSMCS